MAQILYVCRKHLAMPGQVIPSRYEAVKCKLQSELSKCKYCAITTDLWTSQHQNRSYISLTADILYNTK